MEDTREFKAQPKKEVPAPAEPTASGRAFTPAVDIYETDRAIHLLADMPGVDAEHVSIDLRDDTLTLRGEIAADMPQEWSPLLVEYDIGTYFRRFNLSEDIDQARIEAQMSNGVLRLVLSKAEKATPRRIAVKAG